MKKSEAETVIRQIVGLWREEHSLPPPDGSQNYSYAAFKNWAGEKGYGHYWRFRSAMGAEYDIELWFDDELRQAWRR